MTRSASPALSVVIPVHNAAATLADQLDGIASGLPLAPPTEILVVDNLSTDGTATVARDWSARHHTPVRVVTANDRAGEPYARNVGLAAATADRICYCDGDDVVSPTWLPAMAGGLARADYVTGPIDMHTLNEPWLADVRGASVTTGRSVMYDLVPYAHGCNMGFRRSTLAGLGGFDESYPAGCDLDIAIRMWESGHDLDFQEGASVAYRLRPSLAATYRQGRFYGRHRVRIRARLDGLIADDRTTRSADARRRLWLARHTVPASWSRPTRARWAWVAGQLHGERQGRQELRT